MKRHFRIISSLLTLALMVGCVKENSNKMDGVTIKLNGFDLDDAKAMAHLKTDGAVTKAPVEFQQSEALYLVYGGNEIRLPEIKFSVEVPDSMSNWEKNQLLKDIHITVGEPFIKDCGNYIFVRTSLGYYTTFNGFLDASLHMGARAFYLIRKEDGQLYEITDWSNGMAYLLLYQDMVVDSAGNYYLVSSPGSHATSVHRLFETQDGFEVRTADVGWVQIDFSSSIDGGLTDLTYIADQFQLTQTGPVVIGKDDKLYTYSAARRFNDTLGYFEGIIQLGIVSPDLTCEKVRIDGSLLGFHKSGNDLMLFVIDRSTFKLYNATDGCKLLSSVTVDNFDERYMDWGFHCLGNIDGIYTFCSSDLMVKFDVNRGECTRHVFDEAITEYLHAGYHIIGGNFYIAYSPWESDYVDVLKIDVLTQTVEKLKRLDVPDGCFFTGVGIWIEDEAQGKVHLHGTFVNKSDSLIVGEVNVEMFDSEIAEAYAKANAVEDYGIDFGSYTVVNVVPLK